MMKKIEVYSKIVATMNVNENEIKVMRIENEDYFSLTDLARFKNSYNSGDVIIKWMVIKVLLIFIVYGKSYIILILNPWNPTELK